MQLITGLTVRLLIYFICRGIIKRACKTDKQKRTVASIGFRMMMALNIVIFIVPVIAIFDTGDMSLIITPFLTVLFPALITRSFYSQFLKKKKCETTNKDDAKTERIIAEKKSQIKIEGNIAKDLEPKTDKNILRNKETVKKQTIIKEHDDSDNSTLFWLIGFITICVLGALISYISSK